MKYLQSNEGPSISMRDAASYLGLRLLKLCEMARNGEIEARQTLGEPRILWSEIHRYIAKRAGAKV